MPLPKLLFPPESNGYQLSNGDDIVEIQVEGGRSRRRRDYNSKPFELDVNWTFNQAEYQYFKAFYNTAIKKGSLPFLIDLIVDNPYLEEFQAHVKTGTVVTTNPQGLAVMVSATLEILPKSTTDFDFAVLTFGMGSGTFFSRLEQLVNYDLAVPA